MTIIDLQFLKHTQNVCSGYGGHVIKQNLSFAEGKPFLKNEMLARSKGHSKHLIFYFIFSVFLMILSVASNVFVFDFVMLFK